ncbi:hypothetical protein [Sphingomonas sp.]|uniref:hypothetical protein n=1 Tax=Sphingomonas sp. TaxID=28214 RepID=UPI003B001938
MSGDVADCAELRALLAKATPGPWIVNGCRGKVMDGKRKLVCHDIGPDGDAVAAVWFNERTGEGWSDARAIVAAINGLPALLDHIDGEPARIAEAVRERDERAKLVGDMCWDADDPERPYDDPLEWHQEVWPQEVTPFINRFQWAERLPDSWELFIPPVGDDDEWTVKSFDSAEKAEAARSAILARTQTASSEQSDGGGA